MVGTIVIAIAITDHYKTEALEFQTLKHLFSNVFRNPGAYKSAPIVALLLYCGGAAIEKRAAVPQ